MKSSTFPVRLFYSYSHKDARHREQLAHTLALMKQRGIITDWSDANILPGQNIPDKIQENMKKADIIVFLISSHFLSSRECMKEWKRANSLCLDTGKPWRLPIILDDCAWEALLADDDIKALPRDGVPIMHANDSDIAWQQVYDGIEQVVDRLRTDFSPKSHFLKALRATDVISQKPGHLNDLFVFLPLTRYQPSAHSTHDATEQNITNIDALVAAGRVLVHGDDMCGKTALARYTALTLITDGKPVLLIDLDDVRSRQNVDARLATTYHSQFHGDYQEWKKQDDKVIVLDNLAGRRQAIDFVSAITERFHSILVLVSTDEYVSYYRDDMRLVDYSTFQIQPLTRVTQEALIRKRLTLMDQPIKDGVIDQVEKRVNSIVGSRLVPRYPFYVLSIIQTLEIFMPNPSVAITSHGHCYYVWILARLMKAGIPKSDDAINVCQNFLEYLAYAVHQKVTVGQDFSRSDFDRVRREYKKQYILPDAIVSRLTHTQYGILTNDGRFQAPYMFYFFLGRYLAAQNDSDVIDEMCRNSHITANYLTLLFIIHHATDNNLIESIVVMTMCTLDQVPSARLDRRETGRFRRIISDLPTNILSDRSVEAERQAEREARDASDSNEDQHSDDSVEEGQRALYQLLRNNEILGQVLRVRYGKLRRDAISEIVEAVAEGGLRLVNSLLSDEQEITELAHYIHSRDTNRSEQQIVRLLQFISFFWTMINLSRIVDAIGHHEIRDLVGKVVVRKDTAAYDIIGYFCELERAEELTSSTRKKLQQLLQKHDDPFVRGVLSLKTQHYMNTHKSSVDIEQAVCSDLGIRYRSRIRLGR